MQLTGTIDRLKVSESSDRLGPLARRRGTGKGVLLATDRRLLGRHLHGGDEESSGQPTVTRWQTDRQRQDLLHSRLDWLIRNKCMDRQQSGEGRMRVVWRLDGR